jgi:hypothetical protein
MRNSIKIGAVAITGALALAACGSNTGGAIAGALLGGILGHQVGGGAQGIATAGGAVAGGPFTGNADFRNAAGSARADVTYYTLQASASREQRIFEEWTLLFRADGQWASQPLLSIEQFGIGGGGPAARFGRGAGGRNAGYGGGVGASQQQQHRGLAPVGGAGVEPGPGAGGITTEAPGRGGGGRHGA